MAVKRYNGTGWEVEAGSQAITYNATAPTSPAIGDVWVSDTDIVSFDNTVQTGFRNAIINGDFSINQRQFTSLTTNGYGFDRWTTNRSGGTSAYSTQPFTAGNDIPGYEPINYARLISVGQTTSTDFTQLQQPIEDVRTFAGQTVTVSFWARAASGTPKVAVELAQVFGTAGSSATNTYVTQVTLSTSWVRYTATSTLPSISGKTIGTNNTSSLRLNFFTSAGSSYDARTGSLGIQSTTIDFWGVQVEKGSTATPFEVRPAGTELALCERYYEQLATYGTGTIYNGAVNYLIVPGYFATTKRVIPSIGNVTTSTVRYLQTGGTFTDTSSIIASSATRSAFYVIPTIAGYSTNGYAVFFTLTSITASSEFS